MPIYFDEMNGVDELLNVLERVKSVYYTTFLDKATYLLINVNQGHYFSNGNKRLSLTVTVSFIYENKYRLFQFSKEKYRDKLMKLFPECINFQDYPEFDSLNFAFYNLTLIIAKSNKLKISQDSLKERVKKFIEFSVYPKFSMRNWK